MQQPELERILGQKVLIDYKVGGGGAVGWAELVRSKPDGYTICGINVPHIILQPLQQDVGYKTEQIVPIAFFERTPLGLAVLNSSPYKTLRSSWMRPRPTLARSASGGRAPSLATTWPRCGSRN